MSDAIGLIGFYFTLVGFISGLFFTRIDSWYGSVRSFYGSLSSAEMEDDANRFRNKKFEMKGLQASKPVTSFVAIGIFLISLAILACLIPIPDTSINPLLFVYLPLAGTVLAYWAGGTILLWRGNMVLAQADRDIKKASSG